MPSNAQIFDCAYDRINSDHHLSRLQLLERTLELENSYKNYILNDIRPEGGGSFILPIVFHVIHNGGPENISDGQVTSALEMLNESFDNVGYYDQGTGEKMDIQFCLAQQDPSGNLINGIMRAQSTLTDFDLNSQDQAVKDLSRFPATDYINVWIVNEIWSGSSKGVAGYAYLPSAHGRPFDGIVVEAKYTGNSFKNNAILTHEMGHYLGLLHTFQGGCSNLNCLVNGDKVCDTPPDGTTSRPPCGFPNNSCQTDALSGFSTDQNDMIINYMDYSNLECYSAFTLGQKDRMCFFVENVRQSLLSSRACEDPCRQSILAAATLNGSQFEIGEEVQFTNTSQGAVSFQWFVNGVELSNDMNFQYTFPAEGEYKILMVAVGLDPLCEDEIEWIFDIRCRADASFLLTSREFAPGDALLTTIPLRVEPIMNGFGIMF